MKKEFIVDEVVLGIDQVCNIAKDLGYVPTKKEQVSGSEKLKEFLEDHDFDIYELHGTEDRED